MRAQVHPRLDNYKTCVQLDYGLNKCPGERLMCPTSLQRQSIVFNGIVMHPCFHQLDDCGSLKEGYVTYASKYVGKNTVKVLYLQSRIVLSFILFFLCYFSLIS